MSQTPATGSYSADEVARFTAMAEAWWDPAGKFKPLHKFNPVRLAFMRRALADHFGRDPAAPQPFVGLTLLDVGCGGGLLSEPLARWGFAVTGVDAGAKNIGTAQVHAAQMGLDITYRVGGPEDMDQGAFDVVLSMEVIEHVPDPDQFVALAAGCLKPGGMFFGATMNRTVKAFLLAKVGAEYVLNWLPRGTHDWKKFIKPSEFAAILRSNKIEVTAMRGMEYDLLADDWRETASLDVNYMLSAVKCAI